MFSANEIKQHLLGAFEIAIFMPSGFERFQNDRATALRSFKVLFFLIPIALFAKIIVSETHAASLLLIYTPEILFTYTLFLGLVYLFAKQCDRLKHLYKYITVSNWFNCIAIALILPAIICLALGTHTTEQVQSYMIFMTLASYVYTAYILTHVLRVPWELGGFVSICGMLINETTTDFIKYLENILYVT